MRLPCVLIIAALVASGGTSALAQNCKEDITRLQEEMAKHGKPAMEAGKRKAPPSEMCPLIKRFAEAEAKMVKYFEENQPWCQIPPPVVEQAKARHKGTLTARSQICAAAARGPAPGGPPPGKGIGALGGPTGLGGGPASTPTNPSTQGSGVFSTLGGASK